MNYKKEMLQNDVKNNSRTLRLVLVHTYVSVHILHNYISSTLTLHGKMG